MSNITQLAKDYAGRLAVGEIQGNDQSDFVSQYKAVDKPSLYFFIKQF
ncbi:MAG: hypothetical protein AAF770_01100 [Bacteroidota bacterium]